MKKLILGIIFLTGCYFPPSPTPENRKNLYHCADDFGNCVRDPYEKFCTQDFNKCRNGYYTTDFDWQVVRNLVYTRYDAWNEPLMGR